MPRALVPFPVLLFARCLACQAPPTPAADHLAGPFANGWMLVDTNGDGIADFIAGKIGVRSPASAAHNAAAANIAARFGLWRRRPHAAAGGLRARRHGQRTSHPHRQARYQSDPRS